MHSVDPAQARDALLAIPPDLARDDWVKAGMAAHAAGLSLDDFDTWSASAPSYNAADCRTTWRSFKAGKGIGPGTLFQIAQQHGWRKGHAKPERKAPARPAAPRRKPAPGATPAEVFARCVAATNAHPYIAAKHAAGVPLESLRVVPAGDPLTIAGLSMAGWLAVPAFAQDGALQSVQFTPPPGIGKKLNMPGMPISGAWHVVGELEPAGVTYVCEGIGQAWACWQATGSAAVVCFGAGNVRRVSEALRERDSAAKLVLVPDVGKEHDAEKIAIDLGAAVARMPEGWPQNSDVSDLAQRDGRDAVEMLLEGASEPQKPAPRLKPVSVTDIFTRPAAPPGFVWDGYLPRSVVTLLGAHGGTGKSTIGLMLVVCASAGRPLFGIHTEPCKTLFVSLEDGVDVVRHRLAKICRTWSIDPQHLHEHAHIVDATENPELFTAENRGPGETTATYCELRDLVQSGGFGLVVIDNASDAYGGDEIQRRQVRAFMRSLAEVARATNCAVMLLGHVDKSTSRARKAEGGEGYSGSTAWHNSARSRLFLTRAEDGTLTLEHQKSNFGKCRDPLPLQWPDGGLPELVTYEGTGETVDINARLRGRGDDDHAIALLRLIAEFESRGQYCSPATTSRNHVHAMLRSEPAFLHLKLKPDDTRRIVNQCQRADWIEPLEYRDANRKPHQRWTLTDGGRAFAGLSAPTAPTCANFHDGAHGAHGAGDGAPTAPSSLGGVGGERAHKDGAKRATKAAGTSVLETSQ